MIGEPSESPMTGPPPPTRLHHPMALTRSSREKTVLMSAPEAVPVAAPWTPSRARAKSSIATSCDTAVSSAATIAPTSPKR